MGATINLIKNLLFYFFCAESGYVHLFIWCAKEAILYNMKMNRKLTVHIACHLYLIPPIPGGEGYQPAYYFVITFLSFWLAVHL